MYFPVSGVETPLWLPPVVAFTVSYFTSMAGLSGAVLILPFQFSILGYTAPSVTPTNLVFNIVGIPSGVYRYFTEGRLNWPLAVTMTAGSLPGIFLGALIRVVYLPEPSSFRLFAGSFLLYISSRMLYQMIIEQTSTRKNDCEVRNKLDIPQQVEKQMSSSTQTMRTVYFSVWRTEYEFGMERFGFNTIGLFLISLVVGLLGGIYGIGGAAIIAPFILTFFKLPVHTIAGATLISACVTSVAGVLFYELVGPTLTTHTNIKVSPDWALGALFGVGGLFGMYLGAATQKYVPGSIIKAMLAAIVGAIGINYVLIS